MTGADTITVTRNEILYSLNKPDDFILAIIELFEDSRTRFATCEDRSNESQTSA